MGLHASAMRSAHNTSDKIDPFCRLVMLIRPRHFITTYKAAPQSPLLMVSVRICTNRCIDVQAAPAEVGVDRHRILQSVGNTVVTQLGFELL